MYYFRMARKEDEKLTLVSSEFVKSIAEEAEIQIDNEKVRYLYNFNRHRLAGQLPFKFSFR